VENTLNLLGVSYTVLLRDDGKIHGVHHQSSASDDNDYAEVGLSIVYKHSYRIFLLVSIPALVQKHESV
jgi:hypothetical protein